MVDHWWQTESGWPIVANMIGVEKFPIKPGSASLPVCGYNVQVLDKDGKILGPNSEGFVSIKLPLPPGTLKGLWGNPERFYESYFKKFNGYYFSGDGGYKDFDGYIFITGRVDDVINVAGHRLSTAEMEEIVAGHDAVAECAVFGVHCDIKGQKPLGLIVLKDLINKSEEEIVGEIKQSVRHEIGAIASIKDLIVVNRLPKTRSGKILRKLLRNIADNQEFKIPSTIDDISIIGEIQDAYAKSGIGIS